MSEYHSIIVSVFMEKNKKIDLKKLYLSASGSHKGQNGRLLIIGGSKLFHSASLWSLKVASRIVDLVHFASTEENNKIVQRLKQEFRDGIVIPRVEIESYIEEDDCILIGPGMVRNGIFQSQISNLKTQNLEEILELENEGLQTYFLSKYLLNKYPQKEWVIDAGALQMMEPEWIPNCAILTPHLKEFAGLESKIRNKELREKMGKVRIEEKIKLFAKEFHCTILLKGSTDYVASEDKFIDIKGGNAGMTKGGTGDVLAGLVAALYCKNDSFLSAAAASFINKKAGEDLYRKMGLWFNASDLSDQIPATMKDLLL